MIQDDEDLRGAKLKKRDKKKNKKRKEKKERKYNVAFTTPMYFIMEGGTTKFAMSTFDVWQATMRQGGNVFH